MKSLVTLLVSLVDISGTSAPGVVGAHPRPLPGNTATSLYPQRTQDETGTIQLVLNQDPKPVGATLGLVHIQGRLHADAAWSDIYEKDLADFDGLSGTDLGIIVTGISMVHEMRVSVDVNGTYDIVAGTLLSVAFQE